MSECPSLFQTPQTILLYFPYVSSITRALRPFSRIHSSYSVSIKYYRIMETYKGYTIAFRAGPINDIISNRDKIYVDNDDKLWTLLLDMDWSKSQSHRRNMRQQPISVQRARQSTKSISYRTLRSKLDTRTTTKWVEPATKVKLTSSYYPKMMKLSTKKVARILLYGSGLAIWKVTRRRLKRSVKYVVGLWKPRLATQPTYFIT